MTVCFLSDLRRRFSTDDFCQVHCFFDNKHLPETGDKKKNVCVWFGHFFYFQPSGFTDVLSSDVHVWGDEASCAEFGCTFRPVLLYESHCTHILLFIHLLFHFSVPLFMFLVYFQ